MCEVLDRVENKGRQEAKREIARSLEGMGMPVEKIAEAVKVSVDVVKQWLDQKDGAPG